MITFKHRGSFANTERFFSRALNREAAKNILNIYGQKGVEALRSATPYDSGLTADSWDYLVTMRSKGYALTWVNNNIVDGVQIAIILQYGHGTRTGGLVRGRDYINPTIRPIFDEISEQLIKELANS